MSQFTHLRSLLLAIGTPLGMFFTVAAMSWLERLVRRLVAAWRAPTQDRAAQAPDRPKSDNRFVRRRRGDRLVRERVIV